MNWMVDKPRRIGERTIAAIVEFSVRVHSDGPLLSGTAKKQPLVILHLKNSEVTGIDINGHGYEADEIELLYPTAIAQVQALMEDAK